MSYKIDQNLLFCDLNDAERMELAFFASKIVLEGYTDIRHPAFEAFAAHMKLPEERVLLVYATAFPQRALLSVVRGTLK